LVEDLDKANEALNEATSEFIYEGSPFTTKTFAQMFIEFGIKSFKVNKRMLSLCYYLRKIERKKDKILLI
jgi:hypothetical protein